MKKTARKLGQAGFTLIEILVALILISLLVAAVFPVVTQQAGQADAPRLANDLTNIRSGVELFNVNLRNRFPASLDQLTTRITASQAGLGSSASYGTPHINRWDGPYIDAAAGGDIVSGYDAKIANNLEMFDVATNTFVGTASVAAADFVALSVAPLESSAFTRLNSLIDGDADNSASPGSGMLSGKLRMISTGSPSASAAVYLAVPYRQ